MEEKVWYSKVLMVKQSPSKAETLISVESLMEEQQWYNTMHKQQGL